MDRALAALVALAILLLLRWYVLLLQRAWPAFRGLLTRSTLHPGKLSAGPVEVSGKIFSEAPLYNRLRRSCAILQVEIHNEWTNQVGKQSFSQHTVRRQIFCAPGLILRDGAGRCRLEVSPENLGLSANPHRQVYEPHEHGVLLFQCPAYRPLVVPGAKLTVIEWSVRNKSRVIVTGHAVPDEQAEPEGYRQGAAEVFKILAPPREKIFVSPGTQGQALARLSAPLFLGLSVLGAVGYLAWLSVQLALNI